jgi:hypothetical protein
MLEVAQPLRGKIRRVECDFHPAFIGPPGRQRGHVPEFDKANASAFFRSGKFGGGFCGPFDVRYSGHGSSIPFRWGIRGGDQKEVSAGNADGFSLYDTVQKSNGHDGFALKWLGYPDWGVDSLGAGGWV